MGRKYFSLTLGRNTTEMGHSPLFLTGGRLWRLVMVSADSTSLSSSHCSLTYGVALFWAWRSPRLPSQFWFLLYLPSLGKQRRLLREKEKLIEKERSKIRKSMEVVNFFTKRFCQSEYQIDSGGIRWLPALAFFLHHHDTVLSSRITVPSVPSMSDPKRAKLGSVSRRTKDFW